VFSSKPLLAVGHEWSVAIERRRDQLDVAHAEAERRRRFVVNLLKYPLEALRRITTTKP
jgi:hypothetical protein